MELVPEPGGVPVADRSEEAAESWSQMNGRERLMGIAVWVVIGVVALAIWGALQRPSTTRR